MSDRNIVPGSLVVSTGQCLVWPTSEGSMGNEQGNRVPQGTLATVIAVKETGESSHEDRMFRWFFLMLTNRTSSGTMFGWAHWASPLRKA